MLRVSDETRERVLRLGREEFGGSSAEETIARLLDEHWQARAIAAVRRTRDTDPEQWVRYLSSADARANADAPLVDEWAEV